MSWIISLIPDGILHLIVIVLLFSGIAMYAFSFFLNLIPSLQLYRVPIQLVGALLAVVGVYFLGSYSTEMAWRERVKELENKVAISEEQSKTQNAVIQKVYVDRVRVVKDTKVVIQEKIVKDASMIDAKCEVIPEALSIVNEAAKNPKAKK